METLYLFIPGNGQDPNSWKHYRNYFIQHGISEKNIVVIDFEQDTPLHEEMASQIERTVRHHPTENISNIKVIAHSLGVTGGRYWLNTRKTPIPVNKFVALAGPNKGTVWATICKQAGMTYGRYRVCPELTHDFINSSDKHPLKKIHTSSLKNPPKYYAVAGTHDRYYTHNPSSPLIKSAEINKYISATHNGVKTQSIEKAFNYLH